MLWDEIHIFKGLLLLFNPQSLHTANAKTPSGCKSSGALTNIVLYSEVLVSQNTRPDALLSLKFPQPKLPVKTLLGEEGGKKREERGVIMDSGGKKKKKITLKCHLDFRLKDARLFTSCSRASRPFCAMCDFSLFKPDLKNMKMHKVFQGCLEAAEF